MLLGITFAWLSVWEFLIKSDVLNTLVQLRLHSPPSPFPEDVDAKK